MIIMLLSVVVTLCSSPLDWFVQKCLISRDVTVALSFLFGYIDINLVNTSNTVEDNLPPDSDVDSSEREAVVDHRRAFNVFETDLFLFGNLTTCLVEFLINV